jgi:hypothetical protein
MAYVQKRFEQHSGKEVKGVLRVSFHYDMGGDLR